MKIKVTRYVDAPDLGQWLRAAAKESGKSIVKICRDAEICTQVWYAIINGRRESVSEDLLRQMERAVGQKYPVGE